MTPVGESLAAEIRNAGPIRFSRFMDQALYHPEHGYYRRTRDPFGKEGDFFTAEQMQPVFGILMAARIRRLYEAMGRPHDFTVVELGAGRREMAEAFAEWHYVPLDTGVGELPESFVGVAFSNEFFDALPVDVFVFQHGKFRQQRVACEEGRFRWLTAEPATAEAEEFLRRYLPDPEEGRWYEVSLDALDWMRRVARALQDGYALTIDYGYTRAESIRFPAGTLMSYHRHTALEDVLEAPGERDITAHVNFTALRDAGEQCGLRFESLETLARTILTAGEADQFAAALEGGPQEQLRRRMQLKSLLFGMGETFRVLLQRREPGRRA